MNVFVVSTDRRFREVAAVLLERRGCEVGIGDGTSLLMRRLEREEIEVVVIDASRSLATAARMAAAVQAMSRQVGIVVVEDQPRPTLPKLHTVPKWGSFPSLFAAIERAYETRAQRPGPFQRSIGGAWPNGDAQRSNGGTHRPNGESHRPHGEAHPSEAHPSEAHPSDGEVYPSDGGSF